MARARVLPHREISSGSVVWGDWWARINGQRILAAKRVNSWDYSTPLSFELQPSVDADEALATSGLTALDEIDLVLLAECPSTGHRFTATRNLRTLSETGEVLSLDLPPDRVARFVVLTASLVLTREGRAGRDDIAWKRGARLAQSSRTTVWLEGDAPRFPTEAVSFAALGLEAALWDLDTSFTDLDESFLSTVRLLVNTGHPAHEMLLDEAHPGFSNSHSVLEIDLTRRLILRVANDDGLRADLERHSWQEGSVREVLEGISDVVLGSDLRAVTELARQNPRALERKLQSRFEIFGSSK